jgi:thiol-disulfide isomerase/thioredoxin
VTAIVLAMLALSSGVAPIDLARPLSPTAPTPVAPRLTGPAVIVLWASWCQPCLAELQRLPKLMAAAAPLPIVTLAVDPPDMARQTLTDRRMPLANAFADGRDPRVVLEAWGGKGSALPIAVAIDRDGKICGRKLGLLGTDQLKEWAVRCSQ